MADSGAAKPDLLPKAALLGIIAGSCGLVLLGSIALAVYFICFRNRKQRDKAAAAEGAHKGEARPTTPPHGPLSTGAETRGTRMVSNSAFDGHTLGISTSVPGTPVRFRRHADLFKDERMQVQQHRLAGGAPRTPMGGTPLSHHPSTGLWPQTPSSSGGISSAASGPLGRLQEEDVDIGYGGRDAGHRRDEVVLSVKPEGGSPPAQDGGPVRDQGSGGRARYGLSPLVTAVSGGLWGGGRPQPGSPEAGTQRSDSGQLGLWGSLLGFNRTSGGGGRPTGDTPPEAGQSSGSADTPLPNQLPSPVRTVRRALD
jgi:hypothetical protein